MLGVLGWPSRIDPVYWDEPLPPPMVGVLAPNNRLAAAELLGTPEAGLTEDLVVAADGSVCTGGYSGHVERSYVDPVTGEWAVERVASVNEGVVLLGVQWVDERTLAVAGVDALYTVDIRTGAVDLISTGAPAQPFGFVNDVATGPDGTIYFTDSTMAWTIIGRGRSVFESYETVVVFQSYELLENRPHGLLYAWDPVTRQTRIEVDGLYYPNGVALSSDEQSVFVAESVHYTIQRRWIEGPNAGRTEVLADNLPGIPDWIMSDGHGRLFVAMVARRRPLLRFLHRNPWLSQILNKLRINVRLVPPVNPRAFFIVLDERTGEIIDSSRMRTGILRPSRM